MRKQISLLMMLLLLVPAATSCRAGADERTGQAEGYGGPLTVSVTMQGEDIVRVRVTSHTETQGVGTRAIETLPAAIEEADSIQVDSVSGATVTSNAIKQAVSQAMGSSGALQDFIPMDGDSATQAPSLTALTGVGIASTGRVGPGKAEDGSQVYSFNVVFAAGQFEEDGTIRRMQVDQLEVVTPNLGGGSAFSGFPTGKDGEEAFLREVSSWETKGAMGEAYMLTSGSWRTQMDAYEQAMIGKTVEEVKAWYAGRSGGSAGSGSSAGNGSSAGSGTAAQTSETTATDADDAGAAQPMNAMADVPAADAASSATMSLQGEYGDILLAIERAWEDAQQGSSGAGSTDSTLVDTNTVTDSTNGEGAMG